MTTQSLNNSAADNKVEPPQALASKVERFHTLVCNLLLVIAGLALIAIVILVSANIALRQIATSFGGTAEIVGWLTAVLISMSLAHAQRIKVHVSMSALLNLLPRRIRLALQILIYLVSFLFFALLAYEISKFGINIMNRHSLSPTLQLPYYGFILIVAFGFLAFCMTLLLDLLSSIRGFMNTFGRDL
tara:strand:- start:64022 stop:64585 length:564 start_codon:yes stop_codon:yes gene_type:complete